MNCARSSGLKLIWQWLVHSKAVTSASMSIELNRSFIKREPMAYLADILESCEAIDSALFGLTVEDYLVKKTCALIRGARVH